MCTTVARAVAGLLCSQEATASGPNSLLTIYVVCVVWFVLLTDHVVSLQPPPQGGSPPPPPGAVSGNITVGPASPGASPTATGNVTVGPASPGASPAAGQSPQVGYTDCVVDFPAIEHCFAPCTSCFSFAK